LTKVSEKKEASVKKKVKVYLPRKPSTDSSSDSSDHHKRDMRKINVKKNKNESTRKEKNEILFKIIYYKLRNQGGRWSSRNDYKWIIH
jgi:hypothetical protein